MSDLFNRDTLMRQFIVNYVYHELVIIEASRRMLTFRGLSKEKLGFLFVEQMLRTFLKIRDYLFEI